MPRTVSSDAKKGASGKRHPLNMRTTKELRDRVEKAAVRSGRSLAQEVEVRIQHSLDRQEHLVEQWGSDVFDLAESMARSLWHIERETGKRWVQDDRTYEVFAMTITQLVKNYRDLVLLNRQDLPDLEGTSVAELAEKFARLGGINPPRIRKDHHDHDRDDDERRSNIQTWAKSLDRLGSRPLPIRGKKDAQK